MLIDLILALGLLMTTASQLRPETLPIGPGELLIALWCGLTLITELLRSGSRSLGVATPLLLFWCLFVIAQMVGLVIGFSIEQFRDTKAFIHDTIAYTLMAGLCMLCLVRRDTLLRLERTARLFVVIGAAVMTLLLIAAVGSAKPLGLELWYWSRFRGWSENPNQYALLACVTALVGMHLLDRATTLRSQLLLITCVLVSLVSGAMTKSDSFYLFVLTAAPLLIALKFGTWLRLKGRPVGWRTATAGFAILLLPALIIAATPAAPRIEDKIETSIESMMEDNDQAEGRFKLWREAWDVGFRVWMLGLGPGPHLTSKQHKRPPPAKFEAHNTPLDLFMQGGIVAVFCFFGILGASFFVALRTGNFALSALVVALAVFSLFHLTVRQPVFWFSLCLCFASAEAVRLQMAAVAAARRRSGAADDDG